MATGAKMSFNHYQNGKYGTLPQNPSGKDMEVTQDMHLKMSKKIAQLTKVIYALNTKNDEHDNVILALKEQHEDRLQQLIAETKEKIEYYRNKLAAENDSSKTIENLQQCIRNHEVERDKAVADFEAFIKQADAREFDNKTVHAQKILEFSQEILQVKTDFEGKLSSLDGLREQYEREKLGALQELEEKHREELDSMRQSQTENQSASNEVRESLEKQFKAQVEALQQNVASLEADKVRLGEEFDLKLSKAQVFYEKELETLKASHSASHDEQLQNLQARYEKVRKDAEIQSAASEKRQNKLLGDISVLEDEVRQHKDALSSLQMSLNNKDTDSALVHSQLADARQQASDTLSKLKQAEAELTATKLRCEQQAKELFAKSTEIGELDATRMQHQSTIADLQSQLAQLKDRIKWLESSKKSLETDSISQVEEQTAQLRSLERALEDMSLEKQTLKGRLERDILMLRESAAASEKHLKEEHQRAFEEAKRTHKEELETVKSINLNDLNSVKQTLEAELEKERARFAAEMQRLQEEHQRVKAELSDKLGHTEEEVKRLEALLAQQQQGLGSTTSQLQSLRDTCDRLKVELDQTRTDLRTAKGKASSSQSEYEKLKLMHESKLKESQMELQSKLEQLSSDLDGKWKFTLKHECEKLRQEVVAQKEEDKRAALEAFSRLKDEEVKATKAGWEKKVQELLTQVSELKQSLASKEQLSLEELEKLKTEADAENRKLRREMLESAQDYSTKIDQLERMYKDQLDQLEQQKDIKLKHREEELQRVHREELQGQLSAHRVAVQSVTDTAEKTHIQQLDAQAKKHQEDLEEATTKLEHRHMQDFEQANRDHSQQLLAARMELERAMELMKHKDGENAMHLSELEETVRHREETIRQLEADIRRLQSGVDDMGRELEAKGREILRIRSEANAAARGREEQLLKEHRGEVEQILNHHQREAQDLLNEFTNAQEMLKDKISELQLMLEEAEDRYRERESRPEDLEMIRKLKHAVHDREDAIHKIQEDKKFFQKELVNRETNFNKVFNSDPKVGVMNPLNFATHKKPKGDQRSVGRGSSSSPALHKRLEPIPGSQLHDGQLNSSRPLPSAIKKFVK